MVKHLEWGTVKDGDMLPRLPNGGGTDWIATLRQVCPSLSVEEAEQVHAIGCARAMDVNVASLRALILEWAASTT